MSEAPPPRPSTARLTAPPVTASRAAPRPGTITTAVWLWLAAATAALVTSALTVTRLDALHAEFAREARASDPTAATDVVNRIADLSSLIVVAGGLIFGAVAALLALALRARRGWARVLLVLITVLAIGHAVLTAPQNPYVLGHTTLSVAAVVCLYLPASKPWFT